jgi:hypothetical protein
LPAFPSIIVVLPFLYVPVFLVLVLTAASAHSIVPSSSPHMFSITSRPLKPAPFTSLSPL